jgi:LysR family transcriptional regulator of gallate degradation
MAVTAGTRRKGGVFRPEGPDEALGMRQILCVTRVAAVANVTRAAALLGKSQGAVSKAIAQAERVLGAPLFAGARGQMLPTDAGTLVIARFRAIERLATGPADHFLANASTKRLQQLVALLDLGSIEGAAARLGISRDAVYKSVRETEHLLDAPLFHHLAAGRFIATPAGRALLTRTKLILAEMRHALEDVAELRGRTEGRLSIGCLPSMASHIVPDATAEVLRRAPQLSAALIEGSYDELMDSLQSGEIDVIVGGLAPARDFPDVRTIPLIDDRIVIFGRAGHPLARKRKLSSTDFKSIRWILPMRKSLPKPAFESLLAQAGIRPSLPIIENASTIALNGLLARSDMLTVGSALQMQVEKERGILTEIPFRLTTEVWQTGLVLRESTAPSPAARLFIEIMRERARS